MNHVAMGKHVCEVCGIVHESGEILLHLRLQGIPEDKTITGYGLCEEHRKLRDEGYLALVEVDSKKSKVLPNGNLSRDSVYRTGRVMHMRKDAVDRVFNTEISHELSMVFIDNEAFDEIATLAPKEGQE